MDRREYITRLVIFFLLSGAALLGLQWYTAKYMPHTLPPRPAQPAPGGDAREAAPTTASLTRETSAATSGSTTTSLARAALPTISREDAPRVRLSTNIFDIEFSRRGGVPVRWDVIDPRFAQRPTDINGKPIEGSDKRDPLIEPSLSRNPAVGMPLEVILYEENARYYRELNESLYTAEGPVIDGKPGWRFTSEPNESGLQLIKTYQFEPDSYVARLKLELINQGAHTLSFNKDETGLGLQLGPGVGRELPASNPMSRFARSDVALLAGETLFSRELKKTDDQEFFSQTGGFNWGGIQGLYFAAVLIPAPENRFITARAWMDADLLRTSAAPGRGATSHQVTDGTLRFYPSLELYGPPFRLGVGERVAYTYEYFAGPNQSQVLRAANHNLERLLFHDSWAIMRRLALGMMAMLRFFHGLVQNWGVAILLLTFTVRLLLFPLVHRGLKTQAKAMAEQARLKPLMDKINERYKDDPMRRQQEIMQLFKEHGVNPFASLKGCFWMLIQLPVFFSLYKLLSHSIELRGAGFLWVHDLSQADMLFTLPMSLPLLGTHFNLLPFIVAITQMLTSKFMSQPATDPQQAQMQKMMIYFMPFMVLFFTYGFPAGLMLYWLVSNLWQVLQQIWVKKHMPPPGAPVTVQAIKPAKG